MEVLMRAFFATPQSTTLLFQRIVLGLVILPHGLQKTLGLFGGGGFSATLGFFESVGIPAFLAALVIAAESLGAIGLVVGAGTRLAAFGITATMVGAALTHVPNGFFMNWFGNQAGEGYEYHLLALALAAPLVFRGAGAYSIDRMIAGRLGGAGGHGASEGATAAA
jgi:putative oxidoreductase